MAAGSQPGLPTVTTTSSRDTRTLGLIGLLLFLQFFVYISVLDKAPYLPGVWSVDWEPQEAAMQLNMLLMIGAMVLLVALPKNVGSRKPATVGGFLQMFMIGGFLTWAGTSAISFVLPTFFPGPPLADTGARFAAVTFFVLFTAVAEELVFRVVLPLYAVFKGRSYWWIPSCIAFTIYHLAAYSVQAQAVGLPLVPFVARIGFVAVFGVVLYWLYKRYGYGMAVGVHAGFDLAATASVGPLAILAGVILAGLPF